MGTVRPLREPTIFIVTPGRQQRRKRGVLRCVINIYLPLCDFMTTRIGFGVRNTPGSGGKGSTHTQAERRSLPATSKNDSDRQAKDAIRNCGREGSCVSLNVSVCVASTH